MAPVLPNLPHLGLGLSTNSQRSDLPEPYGLLSRHPGAFEYLEYSAPVDLDEARRDASLFEVMLAQRATVPLLFHPVHVNLFGPEVETPERLAALRRHCEAVGSPWVSNDVAWWHHRGRPLPGYQYLSPPLDEGALELAVHHARTVREGVGVPLLLENPVITCARGPMHVLDFMARLSTAADCWLLLDVGHLLSHQLSRGLPVLAGLEAFPFERVAELHLAGGVITRRGSRQVYVDDHPQPVRDEVWQLLEAIAPRCANLKAITFEGDGHSEAAALRTLARLRPLISPPRSALEQRAEAAPGTVVDASRALEGPSAGPASAQTLWALFDAVNAGVSDEDPVGARAEQDFRLAVLAEVLDGAVPWARLAVAFCRADLARFMTSAAFRDVFEQGHRSMPEAYLRWASSQPLDLARERLIAFDTWLRSVSERRPHQPPTGLAEGVTVATFGLDLSEGLFSARALTRHLKGRAPWTDEAFEASGLEGVHQAVARAPARPWTVALRRVGAKVEVLELTDAERGVLLRLSTGEAFDVPVTVAKGLLQRRLVTVSKA